MGVTVNVSVTVEQCEPNELVGSDTLLLAVVETCAIFDIKMTK